MIDINLFFKAKNLKVKKWGIGGGTNDSKKKVIFHPWLTSL